MDRPVTGRPEWLREIVCRASTLRERLDGAYRSVPGPLTPWPDWADTLAEVMAGRDLGRDRRL